MTLKLSLYAQIASHQQDSSLQAPLPIPAVKRDQHRTWPADADGQMEADGRTEAKVAQQECITRQTAHSHQFASLRVPSWLAKREVEPPGREDEALWPVVRVDLRDAVEEHPRRPAEDEHVARVESQSLLPRGAHRRLQDSGRLPRGQWRGTS